MQKASPQGWPFSFALTLGKLAFLWGSAKLKATAESSGFCIVTLGGIRDQRS